MVIPMDLPLSRRVPRGPMTWARARSLETKVTSLLSDIPYDPLMTWLLPKSRMLCMIRYQEDPLEDAREDGQVYKFMDEENQQKEPRTTPRIRTSDPWRCRQQHRPNNQVYRVRTSGLQPGNPDPSPDIRTPPIQRAQKPTCQPRHPAHTLGHPAPREGPDIWPDARTSDSSCLRIVKGPRPMYPLAPRLFIFSLLPLSRFLLQKSLFLGLAKD